jgi:hypothetical protein
MRTITIFLISILAFASPRDLRRIEAPPEIARLHSLMELRFLDRTTFGMKRILPMEYHGIRDFRPENAGEQSVTSALHDRGYEVALYLAGRGVLTLPPALVNTRRYLPQGPAFITKVAEAADLPSQDALLADSRAGFRVLEKGESFDMREPGWSIAMRPLRANNSCVGCHMGSGAKAGDVLGVAMYVYRAR